MAAVSEISILPTIQGKIVDYKVPIPFTVPSGAEVRIGECHCHYDRRLISEVGSAFGAMPACLNLDSRTIVTVGHSLMNIVSGTTRKPAD